MQKVVFLNGLRAFLCKFCSLFLTQRDCRCHGCLCLRTIYLCLFQILLQLNHWGFYLFNVRTKLWNLVFASAFFSNCLTPILQQHMDLSKSAFSLSPSDSAFRCTAWQHFLQEHSTRTHCAIPYLAFTKKSVQKDNCLLHYSEDPMAYHYNYCSIDCISLSDCFCS